MKSSLLLIVILSLVIGAGVFFIRNFQKTTPLETPLVTSPQVSKRPSPTPSETSETFQFDSSTDLKSELQTVDPKVEDSNIDKLKMLIQSL